MLEHLFVLAKLLGDLGHAISRSGLFGRGIPGVSVLPFRGQRVQRRQVNLERSRWSFVEVRRGQLVRLLQMVDLGRLQLLAHFRLQTVFRLIVRLVGFVDHFQVLGPLLRRHVG